MNKLIHRIIEIVAFGLVLTLFRSLWGFEFAVILGLANILAYVTYDNE